MKKQNMGGLSSIAKNSLVIIGFLLMSACSKKNDADPVTGSTGYPRTVSIEYKITSATGLATAHVTYINESGGMVTIDQATLPVSIKVNRKVKQFDAILIGGDSYVGGELKTEIVVDGKVVDSKSFSGTSVISASSTYVFP